MTKLVKLTLNNYELVLERQTTLFLNLLWAVKNRFQVRFTIHDERSSNDLIVQLATILI